MNVSKEDFHKYRESVQVLPKNNTQKIDQAFYYFIINRCSFSGATLSGGFSEEASKKRFTQSSIDRLKKLDLINIDFTNKDFEEIINNTGKKYDKKKKFIFLDPPYYLQKGSKLYGTKGDMHENFDHEKLFNCLNSNKNNNWMMTYNDSEYIRELYKDYKIIETNWKYGMNKSKESSEIIIIKY